MDVEGFASLEKTDDPMICQKVYNENRGGGMAVETKPGLLNSWKEIAAYLGRGVRTVQRWESLGLPVLRLGEGTRAPVVAHAYEIDLWIRSARIHGHVPRSEENLRFRGALLDAIEQARLLRIETESLRKSGHIALMELVATVAKLEKMCAPLSSERAKVSGELPPLIIWSESPLKSSPQAEFHRTSANRAAAAQRLVS